MKREQAVRINGHLQNALASLDQARMVIAGLAKAERIELGDWLHDIIIDLEDELLAPIYQQYPELQPPEPDWEEPTIDSELTWDEVRLPPEVTEQQLDDIIFSEMKTTWRKTAAMVFNVVERCAKLGLPLNYEMIAARLKVLSDSDRIEGIGDLRMWRYSEVRLKD